MKLIKAEKVKANSFVPMEGVELKCDTLRHSSLSRLLSALLRVAISTSGLKPSHSEIVWFFNFILLQFHHLLHHGTTWTDKYI